MPGCERCPTSGLATIRLYPEHSGSKELGGGKGARTPEAAKEYIDAALGAATIEQHGSSAVASGGVARGIWRSLHPDGEPLVAAEELDYLIWASSHLTRDQISERFRVKSKRAGTLLPGSLVFATLMRRFGVEEMRVSQYGIREGAILEMAAGKILGRKL